VDRLAEAAAEAAAKIAAVRAVLEVQISGLNVGEDKRCAKLDNSIMHEEAVQPTTELIQAQALLQSAKDEFAGLRGDAPKLLARVAPPYLKRVEVSGGSAVCYQVEWLDTKEMIHEARRLPDQSSRPGPFSRNDPAAPTRCSSFFPPPFC